MESADLRVDVEDDDDDALHALAAWLRADAYLATAVRMSVASGLDVSVSGAAATAALATALITWMDTRRSRPRVRVTRDGKTVEIIGSSVSVDEVSRALQAVAVGHESKVSSEPSLTSDPRQGTSSGRDTRDEEYAGLHVSINIMELQSLVGRLRDAVEQNSEEFAKLDARLNPAVVWRSSAPTAYVERYDRWRAAEQARVLALRDMVDLVGAMAKSMAETDALAATVFDAGPRATEAPPSGPLEGEPAATDIYLDTNDRSRADRIFAAVDELLAAFGLEGPYEVEILQGSIRRRAKAFFRRLAANDELQTRLIKMERALELAIIDERQAGVDEKQAAAVTGLLESLADVPSACIRVGSVLVLKYDAGAGPVILARTLSQQEIRAMERFPEIQANPAKVLTTLALAIDAVPSAADSGAVEPSG